MKKRRKEEDKETEKKQMARVPAHLTGIQMGYAGKENLKKDDENNNTKLISSSQFFRDQF